MFNVNLPFARLFADRNALHYLGQPGADPPVCKIFDFHKWKYETAKARMRERRKDVELETHVS